MNTQRRIEALQSLSTHLQAVIEGVNKVADGTGYGIKDRLTRVNAALTEARKNADAAQSLLRVTTRFNAKIQ